jgi:SAM-dependent MidA family methyltransferase
MIFALELPVAMQNTLLARSAYSYILINHKPVEPLSDNSTVSLAEPGEQAKQRSLLLTQCVKSACEKAGGWIPFSKFMNIALYEPGLGYYSGGLQKFGEKGDFITAPEVSPLFAQCLANQVAELVQHFRRSGSEKIYILEFGAGSGILAADMLLALEKLDALPEQYLILELAAELGQRQQQTIMEKSPHLLCCVQWLDELPEETDNIIVIANEVLDAMPVECFRVTANGQGNQVESLMIGVENDQLVSRYLPAEAATVEKIRVIQQRSEFVFLDGYSSEYNPAIQAWLSVLESKSNRIVIILIDYGYNEQEYYHPDRTSGTLMCYHQHRGHADFLWWPGLQDITAFVNFTDVAYCAVELGLNVSGYTTQAAFLLANGLSELHASLMTDDVKQQVKLSQQIKTLTLPSEMGERFKVMALTKNYEEPLTGFSMLDLRSRL